MKNIIYNCVDRVVLNVQLFHRCEVWCSTTSPCVWRALPLRSWVSTNDMSSSPINYLIYSDETWQLDIYVSWIISMRNQYVSPVRKRHSYKYACICIFITLILSNCPTLSMDNPSMFRLGSFSHMLCSGSDAYISSVPPLLFSGYTSSLFIAETCIRRTAGRCCRNFA